MATWILPMLKAVLPHVDTIISAAKPIFTKPRADADASAPASAQQQIAELQAAVAQNDAHIRELAEQLQSTLAALQASAVVAESRARRLTQLCIGALGLSALALGLSVVGMLMR